MNWFVRWRAKRELKRSAKLLMRICDEMPLSVFKNLVTKSDGSFAEPLEAINHISRIAYRMERL